MSDALTLMADLLKRAKAAGADTADAVLIAGTSLSVQRRMGHTEQLERAEGRDLGLRVFVGRRSAIVSSTAVDPAGFSTLAERAVAMAKVVPEDPYGGLADEAGPVPTLDLDLVDAAEPDAAALIAAANTAEEAALAVTGVTNSEGGSAGYSHTEVVLVTSAGFAGRTMRSGYSISATALAGSGTAMQRDYDYSSAVHLADLEDPQKIGRTAGERAVARMNPTRPKTGKLAVVFDPRVAASLLGHLAGAINGTGVARGTSFLKDSMGQRIFPAGVAQEGPDFGGHGAVGDVALHDPATGVAGDVQAGEAHRHGGVFRAVLGPGFGQVALFQLHVAHFVAQALALHLGELLTEVGSHFRRGEGPQRALVVVRPGALDRLQQRLEGLEVLGGDRHRRRRGAHRHAAAHVGAVHRAHVWVGLTLVHVGATGQRRLVAPAEPAHREHHQHGDQRDLDEHAQEAHEAGHPAHEAAAHQHADQAGAEQAAHEAAHEAAAKQAAARRGCGRCHAGGGRAAGLGRAALHRGGGARRGVGGWRRRIGTAATAALRRAASGRSVGQGRC